MRPLDLGLLGPGGNDLCCFDVVGQVENVQKRKYKIPGRTEVRRNANYQCLVLY